MHVRFKRWEPFYKGTQLIFGNARGHALVIAKENEIGLNSAYRSQKVYRIA